MTKEGVYIVYRSTRFKVPRSGLWVRLFAKDTAGHTRPIVCDCFSLGIERILIPNFQFMLTPNP